MSEHERDASERTLALATASATKSYLARVISEARTALRAKRGQTVQPVLALGLLLSWWDETVVDKIVLPVRDEWERAFSVTAPNGSGRVVSARADAMAFHLSAVRDRLSRRAEPEIPSAAFDQVRLSQSAAALSGWDTATQARDIAERLAWETNKDYWKKAKAAAEEQMDLLLDPLGPPGSPARTQARETDPDVLVWARLRANAVAVLRADEPVWQTRSTRIARTEATAAWNSGALAALSSEGRTAKRWLATTDTHTRDSHRAADGQVVPLTSPFRVGGFSLMMPGDPSAPPQETVQCRCTIVGADLPALSAAATQDEEDSPVDTTTTTVDDPEFEDSVCIMAIPADADPVHGIGPEDKHATVLYFGNVGDHDDPETMGASQSRLEDLLSALAEMTPPFTAQVTGAVTPLGDGDPPAQVWQLDSPELQEIFELLKDETQDLYDGADATRYPDYLPHVTIGYSADDDVPPEAADVSSIDFDRLALWWRNEHIDFPLTTPSVVASAQFSSSLFSLVAALGVSADGAWRDQLRIPRGNGNRSGRWTFTPWKHLDDLSALLNSVGDKRYPETRADVGRAAAALSGFDPDNFDVHDPALASAAGDAANILESAPEPADPSLKAALAEAAAGIREFADTDWSLFSESTDIGANDVGGRASVKYSWDGDLPSDTHVNPDLHDKDSQWLKDELDRIANHPVAPSPTARRKRAMYLKELQDRRDRDATKANDSPNSAPVKLDPTDSAAVERRLNELKFDEPEQIGDFEVMLYSKTATKPVFKWRQLHGEKPGGTKESMLYGTREAYGATDLSIRIAATNQRDLDRQPTVVPNTSSEASALVSSNLQDIDAGNIISANREDMAQKLVRLSTLISAQRSKGQPSPSVDVYTLLMSLSFCATDTRTADWRRYTTALEEKLGEETKEMPELAPYRDFARRLGDATWVAKADKENALVEKDLLDKFGQVPEDRMTPEAAAEDVGIFWHARLVNRNCVLATLAWELRRRGIDVHPKKAPEGRNDVRAYSKWFNDFYFTRVKYASDLKGRRGPTKHQMIGDQIAAEHPVGARGAIVADWKGTGAHIWNWERGADGTVQFYDGQVGEVVGPDDRAWTELRHNSVYFYRLDDCTPKAGIVAALAAPDVSKELQESTLQEQLQQVREVQARLRRATRKRVEIQLRLRGRLYSDPLRQEYNAARDSEVALEQQIRGLLTNGEAGKQFSAINDRIPELPPTQF